MFIFIKGCGISPKQPISSTLIKFLLYSFSIKRLKFKTDDNKIFGCASNLWVVAEKSDGKIFYKHDADAFITKGTAKLVIDILNGEKISEVSNLNKDDFKALGVMELLTAQRQNGLGNLLERLIKLAN